MYKARFLPVSSHGSGQPFQEKKKEKTLRTYFPIHLSKNKTKIKERRYVQIPLVPLPVSCDQLECQKIFEGCLSDSLQCEPLFMCRRNEPPLLWYQASEKKEEREQQKRRWYPDRTEDVKHRVYNNNIASTITPERCAEAERNQRRLH